MFSKSFNLKAKYSESKNYVMYYWASGALFIVLSLYNFCKKNTDLITTLLNHKQNVTGAQPVTVSDLIVYLSD
jgi:hypothetical protein